MSPRLHDRDVDRLLAAWLDEGPTSAADFVVERAMARVPSVRRRGTAWWQPAAPLLGLAAAVIVAVAVYFALARPDIGVPEGTPAPLASPSGMTTAPSPSPEAREPRAVATTSVDLGASPMQLRATDEALYALVDGAILRIDPQTEEAGQLISVPPPPEQRCPECRGNQIDEAFDIGLGSAWVAYHLEDQSLMRRFNLESGELEVEILLGTATAGGAGASDVVVAFDSVWVVMCHSLTVARIDPATNEQVALIELGLEDQSRNCPAPYAVTADESGLWVGATTGGAAGNQRTFYVRIDPDSNAAAAPVLVATSAAACGRFATDDGEALWINSCPSSERNRLIRIDASEGADPSTYRLGGYLGDPVVAEGSIWVPRVGARPSGQAVLLGLDPATGDVTDLIQVAGSVPVRERTAAAAIAAFDSIWVAGEGGTLVRIPFSELAS